MDPEKRGREEYTKKGQGAKLPEEEKVTHFLIKGVGGVKDKGRFTTGGTSNLQDATGHGSKRL